jgi:hypothetical protein
MEALLEDYKRKLKTAESMLENGMTFGDEQHNRVKIKASVYRSTIVDIERAMARQQQQSSANCAIFDVVQQSELLSGFRYWYDHLSIEEDNMYEGRYEEVYLATL